MVKNCKSKKVFIKEGRFKSAVMGVLFKDAVKGMRCC